MTRGRPWLGASRGLLRFPCHVSDSYEHSSHSPDIHWSPAQCSLPLLLGATSSRLPSEEIKAGAGRHLAMPSRSAGFTEDCRLGLLSATDPSEFRSAGKRGYSCTLDEGSQGKRRRPAYSRIRDPERGALITYPDGGKGPPPGKRQCWDCVSAASSLLEPCKGWCLLHFLIGQLAVTQLGRVPLRLLDSHSLAEAEIRATKGTSNGL